MGENGSTTTLRLPGVDDLQEVFRGGFSSVYRGWQPAFGRWVAVKVLPPEAHGATSRFDHEVRALGSLSEHPHVVPVYQAGRLGDRPYLVMPFLTGGSLQDRVNIGPVDIQEGLATVQAIADAVAEAHRVGILHRDIKPANILYTAFGVPQLADFGVARFVDSTLTMGTGTLAATLAYAAPEVLSGHPAGPLSDVYSLGATLYTALNGAPPYSGRDGEAPIAYAMRVVHEAPPDLARPGLAPAVVQLVRRAMAKDPGQRFTSAAELRDAIAGASADAMRLGGTVAPTSTPPEGAGEPLAASTARAEPGEPLATAGVPLERREPAPGRRGAGSSPTGLGRPGRRATVAAAAAVLAVAGVGTAVAAEWSGSPAHPAAHRGAPAPHAPAMPSTTSTAGRTGTTQTTISGASGAATQSASPGAADLPPSAGGATSPAAVPPAVLASSLRSYYALVDQHRLDQSWLWLSPAFQARIGSAYYHQFWNSISQVTVLAVEASDGASTITLRYVATNGQVSTETARLGFAISPDGRILIDTDRVSG